MPVLDLVGVYENGKPRGLNVPQNPRKQLRIVQGAGTTVRLVIYEASGALLRLSSLTALSVVLSVKKRSADTVPEVELNGTVQATEGDGRVDFTFGQNSTVDLEPGIYLYDVWMNSTETGREPVVPASPFHLEPAVGLP